MAGERGTTMKKLSDKELVNQAVILRDIVAENKYKAELLSRLNVADNLMCCGNCKHFMYCKTDGLIYCDLETYPFPIKGVCDKWQPDGLTIEDRKK
jgi:hypothetical protein